MKKSFKMLLALVLAVPFVAKADMGAPTIRETKAYIAEDNVICEDYEGKETKLSKGTIVSIFMYDEDEHTYIVETEDKTTCRVKGSSLHAKDKDSVSISDKRVGKLKQTSELLVYGANGVDVYSGPYEFYEKVGHLDKGTKVSYTYFYMDYEDSDETAKLYDDLGAAHAVYVESNGVKGWINILNSKVLLKVKSAYFYVDKESAKTETIAKSLGWATNAWSNSLLFYIDGEYKLIKSRSVISVKDKILELKAKKDLKINVKLDDKGNETSETLKAGTVIYLLSSYDFDIDGYGAIAQVKDTKEFIQIFDNLDSCIDDVNKCITNSFTKVAEHKITDLYTISEKEITSDFTISGDVIVTPGADEPTKPKNDTKKSEKKNDTIVICAIVAGTVAVIAVFGIIALNRKKNV